MEWRELLDMHARGVAPDTARVKAALASGVPPAMRSDVWLTFSGVEACRKKHPQVYEQLCARVAAADQSCAKEETPDAFTPPCSPGASCSSSCSLSSTPASTTPKLPSLPNSPGIQQAIALAAPHLGVIEQVEKDLRRTEAGTRPERIASLRRVLCAFASFNPDVGYVQGMNFIAAALLSEMDEERSFWLLSLIVQEWLPDHFTRAMVGNHVDCRVLQRLVQEHLPRLAAHLRSVDVSIQLLTTRWFLCLWSSVLPTPTLHRLWDYLFVTGPPAMMQAALACLHLVADAATGATDIGGVLTAVKDVLAVARGDALLQTALYRIGDISPGQLLAWRRYCRQLVREETRRMHATRRLLKLQRSSGFSLEELNMVSKLCGPYTSDRAEPAASLLTLTLDVEAFSRVLNGLVPQWHNACELTRRLFAVFASLTRDGKLPSPHCDDEVRSSTGLAAALAADLVAVNTAGSGGGGGGAELLTFEQLVHGLGWLLRGTSARRANLCFRCFDDAGVGAVSQERFVALLRAIYLMYERAGPVSARTEERVGAEASQFVRMMFELYDDAGTGRFGFASFDRAAHQHPLLVQAFQLEQLELPPAAPAAAHPQPSPLGSARLRAKHGVYTGLRPGAICTLDEGHFA